MGRLLWEDSCGKAPVRRFLWEESCGKNPVGGAPSGDALYSFVYCANLKQSPLGAPPTRVVSPQERLFHKSGFSTRVASPQEWLPHKNGFLLKPETSDTDFRYCGTGFFASFLCRVRRYMPRLLAVADMLPSFSFSTFWICSHSTLSTDIGLNSFSRSSF